MRTSTRSIHHLAGRIADRLRALGYPAPWFLLAGRLGAGLYGVQDKLPGGPLWVDPTLQQVEKLIRFLKLQRNQASSKHQNLSQLVQALLFGSHGGMTDKHRSYSTSLGPLGGSDGMTSDSLLKLKEAGDMVVSRVRCLSANRRRPILVAIDGRSGAGKSVLGSIVAEALSARSFSGQRIRLAE